MKSRKFECRLRGRTGAGIRRGSGAAPPSVAPQKTCRLHTFSATLATPPQPTAAPIAGDCFSIQKANLIFLVDDTIPLSTTRYFRKIIKGTRARMRSS